MNAPAARKRSELAILELRALYEQYGYREFRMSRFEEYDFYAEYRSFLQAENILTFHDPSGKLLALKPDITLSIAVSYTHLIEAEDGAVAEKLTDDGDAGDCKREAAAHADAVHRGRDVYKRQTVRCLLNTPRSPKASASRNSTCYALPPSAAA